MTSFAEQMRAFAQRTQVRATAAFDEIVDATAASIVEGSPVTGSPGQPVGVDGGPTDGELRDSWSIERGDQSARIASSAPYAADVEDNLAGARFHNHGPHSVKLTALGFGPLVAATIKERGV
jgi:hypothetical protein